MSKGKFEIGVHGMPPELKNLEIKINISGIDTAMITLEIAFSMSSSFEEKNASNKQEKIKIIT
jgi:hypothetical protein